MTSWVEAVGQVTEREVVIGDGVERHVETVVVGREVVREVDPGDRIPRLFQTARDDDGEADERTVGAFPVLSGFEGRGHLDLRGARDLMRHRPAVACATFGRVGVSRTWDHPKSAPGCPPDAATGSAVIGRRAAATGWCPALRGLCA
jgi:hypothetical protein